jgi:hypothetical protein
MPSRGGVLTSVNGRRGRGPSSPVRGARPWHPPATAHSGQRDTAATAISQPGTYRWHQQAAAPVPACPPPPRHLPGRGRSLPRSWRPPPRARCGPVVRAAAGTAAVYDAPPAAYCRRPQCSSPPIMPPAPAPDQFPPARRRPRLRDRIIEHVRSSTGSTSPTRTDSLSRLGCGRVVGCVVHQAASGAGFGVLGTQVGHNVRDAAWMNGITRVVRDGQAGACWTPGCPSTTSIPARSAFATRCWTPAQWQILDLGVVSCPTATIATGHPLCPWRSVRTISPSAGAATAEPG